MGAGLAVFHEDHMILFYAGFYGYCADDRHAQDHTRVQVIWLHVKMKIAHYRLSLDH